MFKKSLFESIRFPKGKVFEDIYTMSPIFQKANKIVFNDIPLYYYRQREGSILHNQTNELRLEYIKAAMFVNKDIEEADSVIERDDVVDDLFSKVKTELVQMIHENVDVGEQATDLLMVAKYLERIGDHATNISEETKKIFENKELEAFIVNNSNNVKKLHYYYMLTDLSLYIKNNRSLPVIYKEYSNLLLTN